MQPETDLLMKQPTGRYQKRGRSSAPNLMLWLEQTQPAQAPCLYSCGGSGGEGAGPNPGLPGKRPHSKLLSAFSGICQMDRTCLLSQPTQKQHTS